jgi:hypothetical protein
MALRNSTLVESTRTFDMPFNGETVQITYRLGAFNTDFSTWFAANQFQPESLLEAIERVVVHWDVLDDKDQPIPPTAAAIREHRIPTPFLRCVYTAVQEDSQPGKLSASTSNAGSARSKR